MIIMVMVIMITGIAIKTMGIIIATMNILIITTIMQPITLYIMNTRRIRAITTII